METLLYKPDWPEARQRLAAWWNREKLDRCLLQITAPRNGTEHIQPPPWPETIEEQWTNLDYLDQVNDHEFATTFFGGEAIPIWTAGYPGHVAIPTFYGCPFKLSWETGWHQPILKGPKFDISGLKLDRTCRWWKWGDVMLAHAREAAKGKSIPAMSAIFGVGDTLAALCGTEPLLYSMMDDPDGVRDAELKLVDDWIKVYEHQTGILTANGGPSTHWFGLWAPGTCYTAQCDVSYGISADTFHHCYVPALKKHTDYLDYSLYHVDGIGAFHLVDELAKIDNIRALQILPGTGKPSPLHYVDVLKKVQRLGKGLHIGIMADEVEQALDLLSSRGLCIQVYNCPSEKRAREVIELAARKSVDRG